MKPKTLIILITIASGLAIWAFSKITDSAFLVSDSGKAQESAVEDASQLLDVAIPAFLPSQIKEYEGFNLSFNSDNHTPNYVSWELLPHETDGPLGTIDTPDIEAFFRTLKEAFIHFGIKTDNDEA